MTPPLPPWLVVGAGLASLAADWADDVVAYARHRAAVGLRHLGFRTRVTAIHAGDVVERNCRAAGLALGKLGGVVAGCGCDDNDPDLCGDGDRCECPHCHPAPPPAADHDDNIMVQDWMGAGRYRAPSPAPVEGGAR